VTGRAGTACSQDSHKVAARRIKLQHAGTAVESGCEMAVASRSGQRAV